jgi:hypothetical protein
MSSSWIRGTLAIVMVSIALPATASGNRGNDLATELAAPTTRLASLPVERPVITSGLKVLLVSNAAVHGLDVYSTVLAKRTGAREMNPIMDGGTTRMISMKAAASVVTYFTIRRMAKQHRKAAIVTMLVVNGVTAAVAFNTLKNVR